MATKKRLSLIYEIGNFVNTYLGKVSKFQDNGLFRFGVLSHLLGPRWKTPPLGAYRENTPLVLIGLINTFLHYKKVRYNSAFISIKANLAYCKPQEIQK